MNKKIDIHCHVIGGGTELGRVDEDVYFNSDDNQLLFIRFVESLVRNNLADLGGVIENGRIRTDSYFDILYRILSGSEELDGAVLLALDAVYKEDGAPDGVKTDLWVSNRFLAKRVRELNKTLKDANINKSFYFGASVSPLNPNWDKELEQVKKDGAVLVKLIPSTQHLEPGADRMDFFRKLKDLELPLLCHVGPEYSFPEGIRQRNNDGIKFLRQPLQCGVTVIAAHCASPVFPLLDPDYSKDLRELMDEYNKDGEVRLWTDTSALSLATRIPLLKRLKELFPAEWMVHGSDFPIPIDDWQHLPFISEDITKEEYDYFRNTKNPLDKDVKIKRAHGFSDVILGNGAKLLL